jgi:hypothetical protein
MRGQRDGIGRKSRKSCLMPSMVRRLVEAAKAGVE